MIWLLFMGFSWCLVCCFVFVDLVVFMFLLVAGLVFVVCGGFVD